MIKFRRILMQMSASAALILCAVGLYLVCNPSAVCASAEGIAVNLAEYSSLHWEISPCGEELVDGTVYRYRYLEDTWKNYYTASPLESAPEAEWEGWRLVSTETVARSIVYLREDGYEYGIELVSPYREHFTIDYSGTYLVNGETGEYRARAELTLTDPAYSFVYDPATEVNRRGMSVAISGNKATVTKIWYVAHAENALLDEDASLSAREEREYELPSWSFGEYCGAKPPRLRHGDEMLFGGEQDEGYRVSSDDTVIAQVVDGQSVFYGGFADGTDDTLTFTLLREGEALAEDCPRAKWEYYFNDYMPAGKYTVRFSVKPLTVSSHTAWWEETKRINAGESGIQYRAIAKSYDFEVYAGTLTLDDSELNGFGKHQTAFRVELSSFRFGDYGAFFREAETRVKFSDYLGRAQALVSETYWGEPQVAELYYDTFPRLSYRIAEAKTADYSLSSADWSGVLNETGVYTVYYRAEMQNYAPSPSEEEERYRHYFTAEVYAAEEETAAVQAELRDGDGNTVKFFVQGVRQGLTLYAENGISEFDRTALDDAGIHVLAAFTLTLKEGETAFAPAHGVQIGVSVPASLKDSSGWQIATVNNRGEVQVRSCAAEDGMLVFTADALGAVCFVSRAGVLISEPQVRQGDNALLIAFVAIEGVAVLGLSAALVWLVCARKRGTHSDQSK